LLKDVHEAASDKVHFKRALGFAASSLGRAGADLIHDVWLRTRGDKAQDTVSNEAERLVNAPQFLSSASPELLLALDLSQAKGCAQHKKLLERAAKHADSRALSKLQALTVRKGCGFLRIRDCWSCLRGDKNLSQALERARSTEAFDFSRSAPASAQ
jgi:hypothetical protein